MAACYVVHLACQSFTSGCPEGLPFDLIYHVPLSSTWAKMIVEPLNLNTSLVVPIAHIGRYSYYVLVILLVYYTIKVNLGFITNVFKLVFTVILAVSILFVLAAISTKLHISEDL